jgi:MerR family transcriptional regulator, multidrug-efflux activator
MAYTVKELAKLALVSVRTLHHYDKIGLLVPESHTDAGYRLYGKKELSRLQQILFFKELDFPLKAIRGILDNPGFDEARALEQHRDLLMKRRERIDKLLLTVEKTLKAKSEVKEMEDRELFENFDMAPIEEHRAKYTKEVDRKYPRWQTKDKTKRYGKKEWAEVMLAGKQIQEDLANLMEMGQGPSDPAVQAVIDRHFHHIDSSFYDCSLEIYEGLSHLYLDDSRFTENINKIRSGLAQFQSSAMQIYCEIKK